MGILFIILVRMINLLSDCNVRNEEYWMFITKGKDGTFLAEIDLIWLGDIVSRWFAK